VYTTDFDDAGQVRAYALSAERLTAEGSLPGVLGLPRQLAVSADGKWVGAAAKSGKVCLWDLRAPGGLAPHVLRTAGRPVAVVAFAPDSRRAWVVDGTAAGEALDLTGERQTPAGALPTELAGGPPVVAFPDAAGARLIVVGQGAVQILDVSGPVTRSVASLETPSPVRSGAFDPQTGRLYTGHDDGLRLWIVAGQ
jgi:hypothetical protein